LAETATPSPASQQTRSVGRSPRDPQGAPLSTRSRSGRPQSWNDRLRLVWVARGSTWVQHPRGENVRPQDGPGGLVQDPQPTHFGLVGQWDVLRGIDLPGLMRLSGPRGCGPGPPTGRGLSQVGGTNPSSDRLGAGADHLRLILGEHHADQLGAPGRVVASQGEDGLTNRLRVGMIRGLGDAISRDQAGFALVAATFQEMTDRAWREPERLGQGSHGFALRRSLLEYLPHRDGYRFGHRSRLRRRTRKIMSVHPVNHITRRVAKLTVRIKSAKPTVR
jgi:hypothetical protein